MPERSKFPRLAANGKPLRCWLSRSARTRFEKKLRAGTTHWTRFPGSELQAIAGGPGNLLLNKTIQHRGAIVWPALLTPRGNWGIDTGRKRNAAQREPGDVKPLAIAGFWFEAGNWPHIASASSGYTVPL